jgi:hypothetical protein
MNYIYQPIITESTRQLFIDYITALTIPDIDYVAIGVQNIASKQSTSLMSLPEWQKTFSYNGYAESDPVRRITLHTKRTIIPFSEIDYLDSFGKEIMQERARAGIKDGLVLMDRRKTCNYMLTLGTGYRQFNALEFMKKYYHSIKEIMPDLIKIIERDSVRYIS